MISVIHLLLPVIYLSFISLGLPDGLLGAAWPTIYPEFGVPYACAGPLSMLICAGTILSSLWSDRLTLRWGTGRITALSVATTAAALFGFSVSSSYWQLILWAIPYGLGAGSVDASLNNYVALHYASRHMSWLHCMWGVGASIGPYIMGFVLSGGGHWSVGYRWVGFIQITLTATLFLSLPLWKARPQISTSDTAVEKPLSLPRILTIPGVKEVMIVFLCYCSLEQTAALWSGSYFVLWAGLPAEEAASLAALFFIGLTVGRGLCGFLTLGFTDRQMIRMGFAVIALGLLVLSLPLGMLSAFGGLILVGLGCAPIYPCLIHSTPGHFGAARSQAIIGVEMASAYVGSCVAPAFFGWLSQWLGMGLMPFYQATILVVMVLMYRRLCRLAPLP